MMTDQEIREIIRRELPEILQTDPAVQRILQELTSQRFAGRWETEIDYSLSRMTLHPFLPISVCTNK